MSDGHDLGPLRVMLAEQPAADRQIIAGRAFPFGTAYVPAIDRWWEAFRAAGFPDVGQQAYSERIEHYCAARSIDGIEPRHVPEMDRETVLNLLRLIQREERFCDGAWADWYRRGLFHAIARRLIDLSPR